MIGTVRKAAIVQVVPSSIGKDHWGYPRSYAGYVQARDDAGDVHNFINGSLNGVSGVQVGDTGTVTFTKGAGFALWFWKGD
jgi:hypothetical protein